ncbi:MAG: hypothetical protein V3U24_03960 [Candidatus Neomarinimicrobiota bacterium]
MTRIVIFPATAAILFGLLLLVAPSVIESIAQLEKGKKTADEMILKNRRKFGVGFALLGLMALFSAFIP